MFLDLACDILMGAKNFTEPYEGAHDGDVDLNGSLAAQDA
jgi:hypothetical protein